MVELLMMSIGIGLVVSLVFGELFGVTAGGMIVPGYFAIYLARPFDALATLAAALVTFVIIHALSNVMILYGRRRTALTILIGYLAGAATNWLVSQMVMPIEEVTVIGYIIPGLIAIWLARQGVVETLAGLATASVVVRLILVLILGDVVIE